VGFEDIASTIAFVLKNPSVVEDKRDALLPRTSKLTNFSNFYWTEYEVKLMPSYYCTQESSCWDLPKFQFYVWELLYCPYQVVRVKKFHKP
jgi:hypothetical protein